MKKLLVFCLLLIVVNAYSQDETVRRLRDESGKLIQKIPVDTLSYTWKKGGMFGINISQGSLSNWAAGGDNFSISVNSVVNVFAFYKKNKHSWDNTLDFNLGYVNTTSLGGRKNDDRIDILSKYGYALNPKLNIAGLVNFRSQFFKGYTYEEDVKTLSSTFLSPAYVLVSPGLDYKPNANISIFISPITARMTIVKDDSLSALGLYGVEPGKHSETEVGAFSTINYFREFNKNLSFKSRLDLFSNYEHNPQNIDVFFTNVLNVKLTKLLSITWSVDMIYDDDVRLFGKDSNGAALQFKSLVGIGLQKTF